MREVLPQRVKGTRVHESDTVYVYAYSVIANRVKLLLPAMQNRTTITDPTGVIPTLETTKETSEGESKTGRGDDSRTPVKDRLSFYSRRGSAGVTLYMRSVEGQRASRAGISADANRQPGRREASSPAPTYLHHTELRPADSS